MLSKFASLARVLQAVMLSDTWQSLEPCDVLLVRGDVNCGYIYEGKAYAPLHDSLGDLCAMRGMVVRSVASPYSKLTGIHAHNSPVSYNRAAFIIGLFKRSHLLTRGYAYCEEWANRRREHIWRCILDKANPRCVIGRQPDVGLCRAGKMKSIPVYDLQHGVIADEHPWYGERYCVDTQPSDLPDGYLCWDEKSATVLRKWAPRKRIEIKVLGNPWFLRFLYPATTDLLVQEIVNKGRIFRDNKPVILVSLQHNMSQFYNYAGFNGIMVDALERTILETANSYNWLLRMHPVQMRGVEGKKAKGYLDRTFGHLDSVDWHVCSELPLPVVLQQVDVHITDVSTVIMEAAYMGIYSAILNVNICPGGRFESYYTYERDCGMAKVLPQDPEIIKQWIAERLAIGKGISTLKETGKVLVEFIEEMATTGTNRTCQRHQIRKKMSRATINCQ